MSRIDVRTRLDMEEIRPLRHAFSWLRETSHTDAMADLFTADGTIDTGL